MRPILLTALLLVPFLANAQDPSPAPITPEVWREAVVSVTDIDRTARFFREIGGFVEHWRGPLDPTVVAGWGLPAAASGEALLLGPEGARSGLLRLVRFDGVADRVPTRPGARAWDTGCYFSLMVRMKDLASIYADAIALGWWTETPITYLEFGASKLNVVIFRGPDGVQVQGYERLEPPLPEAVGPFDRMTRPFNIMQMVRDRDIAYGFFRDVLGFATFYNGPPYLAKEPEYMPLGIPRNLTTTVSYRAAIVFPVPGEFGRMEMIEIDDGLEGRDYADRCRAPNLGTLAVRFPVADARVAAATIVERGGRLEREPFVVELAPWGQVLVTEVRAPDGGLIQFLETD
ncbi:MAG: hypothetical protein AAGE01_22640 [Pseudomonadota bacterium]